MPVQRRGLRGLELWCKRVTAGYPNVRVVDLSSSFRDGMAFCAILHHFRPDLIRFDALDPRAVAENNALAFRVAEERLGIPSLLDPEDMAAANAPDTFSVSTYLAQFYHLFKDEKAPTETETEAAGSESSEAGSSADSADGTPLGTPVLGPKALPAKAPQAKARAPASPNVAAVCRAFEQKVRLGGGPPS